MVPYDAAYFQVEPCMPFLHEGGPTGILLLHGFTGTVAHMRPLGDELARRGYTVMGINLPGHATTEADMAHSGWKQWRNAARDAMLTLRQKCPIAAVAGLSMGGLLALLLAEEGLPDGCVTLSAPMATQNRLIRIARLAAPFKPRVSWAPTAERHRALNPAYDYGYSGFPTAKAADLQHLIRLARKNLTRVACPTLVVQSTGDRTIWPGSADGILSEIRSLQKSKLLLEGVPHVCTLSSALPQIAETMDRFLAAL